VNVWSFSNSVSSVIGTLITPSVSPAAMRTVPLPAV
jgi:hypothetical protein